MGIEVVREDILNKAKEQSAGIIAQARKESDKIMKESLIKVEEMKVRTEEEIKKILEMIKKQELASAELESKKMVLEAKKQIIENVFIEVRKKLEAFDDKKRETYIKKLLEKAKKDIEVEYVYCAKRDVKFLKELKSENADMICGLIAENKEKNIRVDYSFDTMLQNLKENELQIINKILFG